MAATTEPPREARSGAWSRLARVPHLWRRSLRTRVVVSIVAAWLFAMLNSGQHSDLMEGIIILFAAALMLYVSGWLMVKQDPHGWKEYLAAKADNALAQDTAWAVAALAFLAVFREGAETVLFVNALATTEGGWSVGLFGESSVDDDGIPTGVGLEIWPETIAS